MTGEVALTEAGPPPRPRTGRWLRAMAVALVGACVVSVVTAGRPDEPTSMRARRPPDVVAPPSTGPTTSVETGADLGGGPPRTTDGRAPAGAGPAAAPGTVPTTPAAASASPIAPPPPPVELGSRPVPPAQPAEPPPGSASAYPTSTTPGGHVATDVGCASGTTAGDLDAFFRARIGPVLGHDYQHVYDLDGGRRLWLFQDTFLDHTGNATRLDQASFAHNTAMVQTGRCFTLLHGGTPAAPLSFEPGTGDRILSRWFWPLGGETAGGRLHVFWVEMAKTTDPAPPDGLGWVPVRTWLATYDVATLARTSFQPAPDAGVHPIYGFAVASDGEHTYLFGNSFDQNLARQGGYHACPCSATAMYLARVPRGALDRAPEYRTADGWSGDAAAAVAIVSRYHAENPMQPRYLEGRWVAATKVDGYWGDDLAIDVADRPWGPWTTVSRGPVAPRGGDPLMNTYHAHLLPSASGGLVVSLSQNARDMLRDAWPHPQRYRLQFLSVAMPERPPGPPGPTTTPPTTAATTTTIAAATTTTAVATTTTGATVLTPTPTTASPVVTTASPTTSPPTTAPPACSSTSLATSPTSTTAGSSPSSPPTASPSSTSSTSPSATTAPC